MYLRTRAVSNTTCSTDRRTWMTRPRWQTIVWATTPLQHYWRAKASSHDRSVVCRSTHDSNEVVLVEISHHLHKDKHGNGVPTTSHVVRSKSIVQGHETRIGGHLGDGLEGAGVAELASFGVGFLAGHAILCGFQWHGDQGIDQSTGHGRAKDVRDGVSFLVQGLGVKVLELIQGGNLEDTHHHRTGHKGLRTSPECADSLLFQDSGEGIGEGFVISSFLHGQRGVVGHSDHANFHGTRNVRSDSARNRTNSDTRGEIRLSTVFVEFVTEGFEQTKARRCVEDLTCQTG
mmetsp:Transcript_1173/g.2491  ORF Transcript_1173/g.2491 Transcript_1173/m.2491 type:complete len:289 (-) Transcript_1173:362-1228(-)